MSKGVRVFSREMKLAAGRRMVAGAQDGPAAGRSRFFSASLAASQGKAPAERRAWRDGVYALMQAMTTPLPQGALTVERMCSLAGGGLAGYHRPGRVCG